MNRQIIVPKYKLAKKRFRFYVDDTHSGGRILDRNFQPIITGQDGLRPILCTTGLLIEKNNEARFFAGLDLIRENYARHIGSNSLPIIHMRQLWGKHPPYDKGKNPFSPVDFETRFKWAREILEYISDENNGCYAYINGTENIDARQAFFATFHSSDMMRNEFAILSQKFGRHLGGFYDVILNPLPETIGGIMANADLVVGELNGEVEFIYDQSEASKGFDLLESYKIARDSGHLTNTTSVIASNTRNHTGLQCADVIAYTQQRKKYAEYKGVNDAGLNALLKDVFIPFTSVHENESGRTALQDSYNAAIMLHYELGIQTLRKVDPAWVLENMYSPAEIMDRLKHNKSFDGLGQGTNLVRDEVHAAWLQK